MSESHARGLMGASLAAGLLLALGMHQHAFAMTHELALCLIATALGASFGCGGSTRPPAKEPSAVEPLSEAAKVRETRSFEEEPVLTPASREQTEKEQRKPKSTPESESAPPVEQPKKTQPHPLSDESWGTAPWGDGPWGE